MYESVSEDMTMQLREATSQDDRRKTRSLRGQTALARSEKRMRRK
jgi:hypothetical protein